MPVARLGLAAILCLLSASVWHRASAAPLPAAYFYWQVSCGGGTPQASDTGLGAAAGGTSCGSPTGSAAVAATNATPSAASFAAGVGQDYFGNGLASSSTAYVQWFFEIFGPTGTISPIVSMNVGAAATGTYGVAAAQVTGPDNAVAADVCASTVPGGCGGRPSGIAYSRPYLLFTNQVYSMNLGTSAYAISGGSNGGAGVAAAFADPTVTIDPSSVPDPQDYTIVFSDSITNLETVPEPAAIGVLAAGLSGLLLLRRPVAVRRRRAS